MANSCCWTVFDIQWEGILFRDFYFRVSFFFVLFATPSIAFCFWVPLRDFFRFNFSAAILFLCFSACLLFCFFASLLFCFSAFLFLCFFLFWFFCFFCFSASFPSLLLCFSAFLLLCFSASLLLCFSASLLLCFSVFSSLFCFLLILCFSACLLSFLWCLFYFSTKDCHYEMDDHKLYTFIYHVLTLAHMVLVL